MGWLRKVGDHYNLSNVIKKKRFPLQKATVKMFQKKT